MKKTKIIISGGGTGGHIFPALSIAGELKQRMPGCDILFVGATGRMEMEKIPASGYPVIGLPVTGFPRKPGTGYVRFIVNLIRSLAKAKSIIRQFHPDLAIGVGGYASGPLLWAATSARIPALIQEQNSYAGITNKLLGRKVQRICVAYEGMERFFPKDKLVLTGNPVRQNILASAITKNEAAGYFGVPADKKVVLITGGSLGARSINNAVLKNLDLIRNSEACFIWQTGSYYYQEMTGKTSHNLPSNLQVHMFLNRMEMAYAASDIVLSRAGAGTISELCLAGKPAVLVPSPNVAEDHQTRNAMALVNREAALLIPDQEIDTRLFPEILNLLNNTVLMQRMSENIKKLALPDAASHIADEAIKLIKP